MTRCILLTTGLLMVVQGCDRRQPPPAAPAPARPPSAAPATPEEAAARTPAPADEASVTVAGLRFPLPAGWEQVPASNPMRLAELRVPAPSGDPAHASTVAFSTAGGDVQSNIARWAGQVRDASGQPVAPSVQTRTVEGLKVHIAEMTGTYAGMSEPARADWTLRGAIIEAPAGLVFVKMTGPAEPMAQAAEGFQAMIDGLKPL